MCAFSYFYADGMCNMYIISISIILQHIKLMYGKYIWKIMDFCIFV